MTRLAPIKTAATPQQPSAAYPSESILQPAIISLNVIQIIYLDDEVLESCLKGPLNSKALEHDSSWKDFPSWMRAYNSISSTYQRAFCHSLEVDVAGMESELHSAIPWMREHCSRVLSFTGSVFFEPHLCQWLALYQLDIETNLFDAPSDFPEIAPSQQRSESDFYNQLRDFFVISDGINEKSDIVVGLESQQRCLIADALRRLYSLSIDADTSICFPDSAGNITLFALLPSLAEDLSRAEALRRYLVSAHECAERIGSNGSSLDVPELFEYIFWGRFHTVMAEDESALERIMPIHLQAQLLWAYLTTTDKCIQKAEGLILSQEVFESDVAGMPIDSLINSIQYAHFMNERFRRSIEGDADLIYSNIESRWHIDASLEQNRDFAEYLSDYMDRSMQKQSLRSENRQNKVLSVIAVLGFLALIDTWSTFLEMFNDSYDIALESPFLSVLFDSTSLVVFNFGFSLVVTILCIVAIIYFLTRK